MYGKFLLNLPAFLQLISSLTLFQKGFSKAPFTRYNLLLNRLSERFDNRLNVCTHDTTGCETGLTTGCIVYTNIQPVVKLGWTNGLTKRLYLVYSWLSNRLYTPVERTVAVRSTRLSNRVVQLVWQPCWTNSLFAEHGCQTVFVKLVWQTRFDNQLNEQLFGQYDCQTGCQTGAV